MNETKVNKMNVDEKYMWRCLQLARKGKGSTKENPLVGCVIVHNNRIIGEGYHREIGGPHAEVNAINSVKDISFLKTSTLYVSLEPCAHHGKTPPCAELIVRHKISKVVVAVIDPNANVAGRGIKILKDAGAEVVVGVLESEAVELNKVFFTYQKQKRPFIILKWAQTKNGFIDKIRDAKDTPLQISNSLTQCVVHKLRANAMSIMVGTNTALMDNPNLNTRKWYGNNPVRIVIDRSGKLNEQYNVFNESAETIVFTELTTYPIQKDNVKYITIDFTAEVVNQIISELYRHNITSILIEGGAFLISSFIEKNMWDEAFIEVSQNEISEGIPAPILDGDLQNAKKYIDSLHFHIKRIISRN